MKLRQSISDTLRVVSFIASLCVVAIHANVDGKWNFLCGTLSWAVPFFFWQSGFFFAISSTSHGGVELLKKKFKGLFLPYIAWIVIATVIGIPLVILNNHLTGRSLFERTIFAEPTIWSVLDSTFAIGRHSPRHLGVLWFVRALMILFIFTPLWKFLARRSLCWLLGILFIYFHFYYPQIDFHGFHLRIGAASYFFLGIVAAVYLPDNLLFVSGSDNTKKIDQRVISICSFSFWIYVTHNIFLSYIIAIYHFVFHKTPLSLEFSFVFFFLVAIFSSIVSGFILKRYALRIYKFLNGGR